MANSEQFITFKGERCVFRFHKDLIKYYFAENIVSKRCDGITGLYLYIDFKTVETVNPQDIYNNVYNALEDCFSTDLKPLLIEENIFSVGNSDFISGNPGMDIIYSASDNFLHFVSSIERQYNTIAAQQKRQAEEQANATITGMGFGVLSNDLAAHALYEIQSNRVLDEQQSRAQVQYNMACNRIDLDISAKLAGEKYNYFKHSYVSEMKIGIQKACSYFLSQYCKVLNLEGKFDYTCLDGISKAKSINIVNNVNCSNQPANTLAQAIQYWPFNIEAYEQMFVRSIQFDVVHKNILSYLGLTDEVVQCIKNRCPHYQKQTPFAEQISKFLPAIEAISVLTGTRCDIIAQDVLSDGIKIATLSLPMLSKAVTNDSAFSEWFKAHFSKTNESDYETEVKQYLEQAILDSSSINSLASVCGIKYLEQASSVFGKDFRTREELITYICAEFIEKKTAIYKQTKLQKYHTEINLLESRISSLKELVDVPAVIVDTLEVEKGKREATGFYSKSNSEIRRLKTAQEKWLTENNLVVETKNTTSGWLVAGLFIGIILLFCAVISFFFAFLEEFDIIQNDILHSALGLGIIGVICLVPAIATMSIDTKAAAKENERIRTIKLQQISSLQLLLEQTNSELQAFEKQ